MIFWGICIVVGDGAGIADFERLGFGFPRVATSGPDQGSNYDRAVRMVMNSVTADADAEIYIPGMLTG